MVDQRSQEERKEALKHRRPILSHVRGWYVVSKDSRAKRACIRATATWAADSIARGKSQASTGNESSDKRKSGNCFPLCYMK